MTMKHLKRTLLFLLVFVVLSSFSGCDVYQAFKSYGDRYDIFYDTQSKLDALNVNYNNYSATDGASKDVITSEFALYSVGRTHMSLSSAIHKITADGDCFLFSDNGRNYTVIDECVYYLDFYSLELIEYDTVKDLKRVLYRSEYEDIRYFIAFEGKFYLQFKPENSDRSAKLGVFDSDTGKMSIISENACSVGVSNTKINFIEVDGERFSSDTEGVAKITYTIKEYDIGLNTSTVIGEFELPIELEVKNVNYTSDSIIFNIDSQCLAIYQFAGNCIEFKLTDYVIDRMIAYEDHLYIIGDDTLYVYSIVTGNSKKVCRLRLYTHSAVYVMSDTDIYVMYFNPFEKGLDGIYLYSNDGTYEQVTYKLP